VYSEAGCVFVLVDRAQGAKRAEVLQ